MPNRTPKGSGIPWLTNAEELRRKRLAFEQQQRCIVERLAAAHLYSISSVAKLGDRLAIGYLLTSPCLGNEYCVWGKDRPMTLAELETYLRLQIEAKIIGEC